ncbi:MAG TPA: LysR family transcriptional regulator [Polyangiaceae bacterium]|nr:LysR family transcriptional regulator [Polyangiaceae bacterium]
MLNWDDLQFFLAIHRAQTLAGAARQLKVEHTTVGRRLGALEEALGAKLFVRTPEGFSLTTMGSELLPLAEKAEAALLQIERVALADDDKVEGTVRVTTSESFAVILGRWLADLRIKHPRITVELLVGNERLDLSRREADLAVRFAATQEGNLVCRRVASIGWAPFAAQSYVAARGSLTEAGTLEGHDVIGFSDSLSQVPGALWIAQRGAGANLVLKSGSLPAACNAAVAGLGVAVLPCFFGDLQPTLVRLLPNIGMARDVYLVVHPDLARVARVRVVMAFLVERFAANADFLNGVDAGATASAAALAAPLAAVPKSKPRTKRK